MFELSVERGLRRSFLPEGLHTNLLGLEIKERGGEVRCSHAEGGGSPRDKTGLIRSGTGSFLVFMSLSTDTAKASMEDFNLCTNASKKTAGRKEDIVHLFPALQLQSGLVDDPETLNG